jgi:hypothetical protein
MSAQTQKTKTPMSQQKKDYLKKYREKKKEFRTQASPEQLQLIKLLSKNIVGDKNLFLDLKAKIEKQPPKPDPTKPHPPPNRYPEAPVVRESEAPVVRQPDTPHNNTPRQSPEVREPEYTPVAPVARPPVAPAAREPREVQYAPARPSKRRVKESIEDRIIREAYERGELTKEDLMEDPDDDDTYALEERSRRSRLPKRL